MKPRHLLLLLLIALIAYRVMNSPSRPKPPGPDPGPAPAGTLHVMYITDHSKPLTQEQTDAMSADQVLDYEQTHCAKDGWRRFDVTETADDLKNDSQFWRDAFAKHGDAPSVTILKPALVGGSRATTYPFPKDTAGLMQLLQKAGGK